MILFKEALCQKASDGSSFVECLNKQGVLAGIKVDEVCIQMLSSVFVQPGLAFYLHKYCISIATPHSSICTKGPLCNVINLQHLFFVAGQCSFLQHDYGLTGALSRNMSKYLRQYLSCMLRSCMLSQDAAFSQAHTMLVSHCVSLFSQKACSALQIFLQMAL